MRRGKNDVMGRIVRRVRELLGLRKPGQLGRRRQQKHTLYELMNGG